MHWDLPCNTHTRLLCFVMCIGLQSYGEFQIAVAAQTAVGTGPYTRAHVVRTQEDGKTRHIPVR